MIKSISFYCTLTELLNQTICKLLEKCYSNSLKTIALLDDKNMEEVINNALWSFSSISFIPHGCSTDPEPDSQPIYITTSYENPNQAKILALVISCNTNHENNMNYFQQFERILIIFKDDYALINYMNNYYHKLKQDGYSPNYFKQRKQYKNLHWQLLTANEINILDT
ncbi:DNA polymerase III chi subunit, HolC family protein [Orientia chuto str. Dubai]|uniref:DNA polymerase III chi subunit, HolC family protein n=1 Tax=Orientia chuto str. Dubai TaxID=1359168 RepID=A0A0F3MNA6_9RICK|nr:DNA polymerase III subunit chi [Candidatus Orientia mediorientalis]KJV57258.1 DNA polymerase III chi subunit, HolC family protein [Orientia chuto str. Dubai]